jgi:hypothetical protein
VKSDLAAKTPTPTSDAKLQCGTCWNTFISSDDLIQHHEKTGHPVPVSRDANNPFFQNNFSVN